jgi:hypothetical protein
VTTIITTEEDITEAIEVVVVEGGEVEVEASQDFVYTKIQCIFNE